MKVNAGFLEAEFSVKDGDRQAAWKLYVELLTRITTQALPRDSGDEEAALDSNSLAVQNYEGRSERTRAGMYSVYEIGSYGSQPSSSPVYC